MSTPRPQRAAPTARRPAAQVAEPTVSPLLLPPTVAPDFGTPVPDFGTPVPDFGAPAAAALDFTRAGRAGLKSLDFTRSGRGAAFLRNTNARARKIVRRTTMIPPPLPKTAQRYWFPDWEYTGAFEYEQSGIWPLGSDIDFDNMILSLNYQGYEPEECVPVAIPVNSPSDLFPFYELWDPETDADWDEIMRLHTLVRESLLVDYGALADALGEFSFDMEHALAREVHDLVGLPCPDSFDAAVGAMYMAVEKAWPDDSTGLGAAAADLMAWRYPSYIDLGEAAELHAQLQLACEMECPPEPVLEVMVFSEGFTKPERWSERAGGNLPELFGGYVVTGAEYISAAGENPAIGGRPWGIAGWRLLNMRPARTTNLNIRGREPVTEGDFDVDYSGSAC